MTQSQQQILQKWLARVNSARETFAYKIFKWLLLLFIAIAALRLLDAVDLQESLSELTLSSVLAAISVLLLARALYSLRWLTILRAFGIRSVSFFYLLRILLLAEFMSIVMPSYLGGDGVRWLKLEMQTEEPTRIATSILLDRIIGLATLLLIALMFSPPIAGLIDISLTTWMVMIGIGTLVIAIIVLAVWLNQRARALTQSLLYRFQIQPAQLLLAVVLSLLGHWVFSHAYFFLFRDYVMLDYSLVISITLVALVTRTIPISVLGVEASDGSLIALMGFVGIASEITLSVLVVIVGSRYLFAFIGLLAEVLLDGRKIFTTTHQ